MRIPSRSRFGFGVIDGYASDSAYLTALGSSPRRGDAYFNTTSQRYRFWDGDQWQELSPKAFPYARLIDRTFASVPSGPQTVDGLTANVGDIVILANYDDNAYKVSAGAWTLEPLFSTGSAPQQGDGVYIEEGSVYGDSIQWFDGTDWRLLTILSEGTAANQVPTWNGTRYVANPNFLAESNTLTTLDDAVNDAAQAQGINLRGGDKTAGTGAGGDVGLIGGSSSGGEQGRVEIDALATTFINRVSLPAAPVSGDWLYYNGQFRYWDGTQWALIYPLPTGTVLNSILAWDGSAWVEDPFLTVSGTSIRPPDDTVADAFQPTPAFLSGAAKTAGTGDGGDVRLAGGTSFGGNRGRVGLNRLFVDYPTLPTTGSNFYLADDAVVDSVAAASLTVHGSNKTAGTGDGGDLFLNAGTSFGGLKGSAGINARKIRLDARTSADPTGGLEADVYYNQTEQRFKYYDGSTWRPLGSGGGAAAITALDNVLTTLPASTPVAGSLRQSDKDTHIVIETDFNASTYKGLSQRFITTNTVDVSSCSLSFTITSNSSGAKTLDIVKDDGSGSPSNNPVDIVASSTNSYTTGTTDFNFTFTPFTLIPGTYHLVLRLAASVHTTYGMLALNTAATPSVVAAARGMTVIRQQTVVAGAWSANASNSYMWFQLNYSGELTVDGKPLVTGDTVLFTNLSSGNNRVYKVAISGPSLTWTLQLMGQNPSGAPTAGDTYYIKYGDQFWDTFWAYSGDIAAFRNHDQLKNADQKLSNLDPKTSIPAHLYPAADNTYDLGSQTGFPLTNEVITRRWRNFYLSGTMYATNIVSTPLDFSNISLNLSTAGTGSGSGTGSINITTGNSGGGGGSGSVNLQAGSTIGGTLGSVRMLTSGGTERMRVHGPNGVVGINTTSPPTQGKLHVQDNSSAGGAAIAISKSAAAGGAGVYSGLVITQAPAAGNGLYATMGGTDSGSAYWYHQNDGTIAVGASTQLHLRAGGTDSFGITIGTGGHVGINGTPAGTWGLDVTNTISRFRSAAAVSTSGQTVMRVGADTNAAVIGSGPRIMFQDSANDTLHGGLGTWTFGPSATGLVFLTGVSTPTEKMWITEVGHVGIGTATPRYISGAERTLTISGVTPGSNYASLEIRGLNTNANGIQSQINFINRSSIPSDENTARIEVVNTSSSTTRGIMKFYTKDSTLDLRMTLTELGNLRLGSSTVFMEATPEGVFTIANNQAAPALVFEVNQTTYRSQLVEYEIERNGLTRFGTIMMCHDGTNTSITDTGTETGSTGVTFSMDLSGGNMRLLYTSDNTLAGTLRYHVRRMAR